MDFFINNWEIITTLIVIPLVGWLVKRRFIDKAEIKVSQSQAKDAQLNTISTNFKVYQDLIDDLEKRFKSRIIELEEDVERMNTLNTELRKVVADQENYILRLQTKISNYEKLEE